METKAAFYAADYESSITPSFADYLRSLLEEESSTCTNESIEGVCEKALEHLSWVYVAEGTSEDQFPIYKITVEEVGYYDAAIEYKAVGKFYSHE